MSVSNYTPPTCRYSIDELDNVVYLVSEKGNIYIDNGTAYVQELADLIALKTSRISLEDGGELNERYTFTHTLTFTVQGYATVDDIVGYYAIVRDKNGSYWLINPFFPCKVRHTFTASEERADTEFQLGTVSNHPLLPVQGLSESIPLAECGYWNERVKALTLNEKNFTSANEDRILYSNDGFKNVAYNKNSLTFREEFDGENVTQELTFNIRFSDYKASWHYNLLEFIHNTYAGILSFTNGSSFAFGLTHGLQPSFSIQGSDSEVNSIAITLRGIRASYRSPSGYITGPIERVATNQWVGTSENGAFECYDDGVAIYELEYEADAFGNRTGRYRCLQGMESTYTAMGYYIVGSFTASAAQRFVTNACATEDNCIFQTTLSSPTLTASRPSIQFSVLSNSSWSVTSSSSRLSISPSSAAASSSPRTVTLTASSFPTNGETAQLTFTFCGGRSMTQRVFITPTSTCFANGSTNGSTPANAHVMSIPYSCCISSVTAPQSATWITSAGYGNGFVKIGVSTNASASSRSTTITIVNCDGTTNSYHLSQRGWYTEWRDAAGWMCSGTTKYQIQSLWSGTTNDTTTFQPTNITRVKEGAIIEENSQDCQGNAIYRYTATTNTYCENGLKYTVMQHQVSYDYGTTWTDIAGDTIPSGGTPSSECDTAYEYDWYLAANNPWVCGNGATGSSQTYYALQEFTTVASGSGTISFNGQTTASTLAYSLNGGSWSQLQQNHSVNVTSGSVVRWRGTNAQQLGRFSSTVQFEARGNIMSLITPTDFTTATSVGQSYFYQLFSGATGLTSAENLVINATNIGVQGCQGMFYNCSNLTKAPQLPATTLGDNAYHSMFRGCTALTAVTRVLPATTVSAGSYRSMFQQCASLTTAPIISATTLGAQCFMSMFQQCTSLQRAPELPATTLTEHCYRTMFSGCTALAQAPELNAATVPMYAYYQMFAGCPNINSVRMLGTSFGNSALISWLNGTASTGTLYLRNGTTLDEGVSGQPRGWTAIYIAS